MLTGGVSQNNGTLRRFVRVRLLLPTGMNYQDSSN